MGGWSPADRSLRSGRAPGPDGRGPSVSEGTQGVLRPNTAAVTIRATDTDLRPGGPSRPASRRCSALGIESAGRVSGVRPAMRAPVWRKCAGAAVDRPIPTVMIPGPGHRASVAPRARPPLDRVSLASASASARRPAPGQDGRPRWPIDLSGLLKRIWRHQPTGWAGRTGNGAEGDRTLNLCIANAALSQLSYGPGHWEYIGQEGGRQPDRRCGRGRWIFSRRSRLIRGQREAYNQT